MPQRLVRIVQNATRVRRLAGAPLRQQLVDLAFFRRAVKASPLEFYLYALWDRTRPIADRLAYLTYDDHRIIEKAVNPKDAVDRLNDKIPTAERFRSAGIPTPRLAGIFETGSHEPGVLTSAAALASLATGSWPNGLVVKPNRGESGQQIMVFCRVDSDAFTMVDGHRLTTEELATRLSGDPNQRWKIEERLLPHPTLARVAPDVLSTLRLLTLRDPTGVVTFGPATWKIPVDRTGVDNFSANGLASPIDVTTGRVGDAVDIHGRVHTASHPVSAVRFSEITLPDLAAALDLARRASQVVPELAAIGWDIALTADGPYLIEGNAWWGEKIMQLPQGRGMVRDTLVTFLQDHGVTELLERRARAEREWHRRFGSAPPRQAPLPQ